MKRVTAAVIMYEGRVLLARRSSGSLAGYWEFPGGKIEAGETPESCLVRELREELGIVSRVAGFLCRSEYFYDTGAIALLAFLVEWEAGELTPTDHDELAWVLPEDINEYVLAPADVPIVDEIRRYLR